MHVQRVLLPHVRRESWTVLGDDGPVQPIERYLAYLTDIERSPNTVKAYAHDLKDWFVFLTGRGLDWREVRLEDVAGFVAWLRRPLGARDGLGGGAAIVGALLRRVHGQPQALGVECVLPARGPQRRRSRRVAGHLAARWAAGHGVEAISAPHQQRRAAGAAHGRVEGSTQAAALLALAEMQAILDACDRLQDRFLFALLHDKGCGSARRWACGMRTWPPPSAR
jgi:integrase/recombinase XerD